MAKLSHPPILAGFDTREANRRLLALAGRGDPTPDEAAAVRGEKVQQRLSDREVAVQKEEADRIVQLDQELDALLTEARTAAGERPEQPRDEQGRYAPADDQRDPNTPGGFGAGSRRPVTPPKTLGSMIRELAQSRGY